MSYNPSQAPYNLDPDLQNWIEEEFQRIAEAFEDANDSLNLLPQAIPPEKYTEGTVVLFLENAAFNGTTGNPGGLYIFRNGLWKRLVEE